jgi:NAD(P)-dependent dehydrogenase (short-subunit alcohol dehydrogenase family)
MDLQLKGKAALVTGSTAGIGWAIACELAAEGAAVVVNGRDEARVATAVQRVRAKVSGADVRGIAADLATPQGCQRLIDAAADVDLLINNLGIFDPQPFEAIADSEWLRFFEVNVMSGVRLARHHLPRMKARNWGRIVFISSESGICPPGDMVHYGMTKSAQRGAARAHRHRGRGRILREVREGERQEHGASRTRFLRARAAHVDPQALHHARGSRGDGGLRVQPARRGDERRGAACRRRRR